MTAVRVALLLVAVAGAVLRPWRLPAFVAPVACALIALLDGLISWHRAGSALNPLVTPLAFLLAAIPLAVLLDRLGYFEQVADLVGGGKWMVPGLWLLGAATVAVLNLDAAVVLLTPLYLRIAERHGRPARYLGFQPVILALLASSFLPVSNLTNLIAVARFKIAPIAFVEHLGVPGLVACSVGYLCYRRTRIGDQPPSLAAGSAPAPPAAGSAPAPPAAGNPPAAPAPQPPAPPKPAAAGERNRRVLLGGTIVVALLLVGFVVGPSFGVQEWEVALGTDVVLVALTRRLPLGSIPWATALVATGLAVLASAAVQSVDLSGLLAGSGPLAALRATGVSALGANVVNNLPALLVALPSVAGSSGHATCQLWPVLLGVNAGPGLLVTGSLASLLWLESMRRFGAPVTARLYFRVGLRVVVPAAAAALLALIVLAPAVGCG